jgi:hypothetical protein
VDFKKVVIALIFITLAIFFTALFWKQPILLSCILLFLAFLKHSFAPIKKGLACFLLVGILGTATESLIMLLGNNPWSYSTPDFINFPIWLIPLWGLSGTIFITLYQGIFKKKFPI